MTEFLHWLSIDSGAACAGLAILAGVLASRLLFSWLFGDLGEFLDCIRLGFQSDWRSLWRGELLNDWWSSLKLGVWFFLSIAVGISVFTRLERLFA
ncbi:hypothetical protein ACXR0O_01210 [Verrucomicrobiota bacterium sgz303538]